MAEKAARHDVWPGADLINRPVDFLALAQSFGVDGERVDKVRDLRKAVSSAVASKRPAIIEIGVGATI